MRIVRSFAVVVVPLMALSLVGTAIQSPAVSSRSVFEEPSARLRAMQLQADMLALVAAGLRSTALERAEQIAHLMPREPAAHYNVACLRVLEGQLPAAISSLQRALDLGFRDVALLQRDPDLAVLREDPRYAGLLEAAERPFVPPADHPDRPTEPGPIHSGVALVTARNTRWVNSKLSLVTTFAEAAPAPAGAAVVGSSAAENRVRTWFQEGTAAGHTGDLYDNRDRDHSPLSLQKFPQFTRVEYDEEAQRLRADWGLQIHQLFDRPVLGNASTAHVNSRYWRSNPRVFLTDGFLATRAYNQYVGNHLYVYPEHNDYDVEHGDVFPANTPFCVISQGSSGSDQPFLEALALTLAAFRPDVKRRLADTGLLMPSVQYVLRRCGKSVTSDDDYLSGRAHPVVFQSYELDPLRMVEMAQQMTADRLPPMVQLQVVEEDASRPGQDYFMPVPTQQLFDTPAAIARVFRTVAHQRRMVVDASGSRDLNGRALQFRWVLLQGDPRLVEIRPVDESGTRAEIIIRWHPAFPTTTRPEILSNRVDIGVFAFNGQSYSAPAFVTSWTLNSEQRIYDSRGRIQSVDYADPVVSKRYVDPLLSVQGRWRDEYDYAANGTLTGWTRTLPTGDVQPFHHDGTLIIRRDAMGRPLETRAVAYAVRSDGSQGEFLEAVPTERIFHYVFTSDEDRWGKRQP